MTDEEPRLLVGLNPYGLTYTLGLQGAGTDRANPNGTGLDGFLAIAAEIGARVTELHDPWLAELGTDGRAALGRRIADGGFVPVVSGTVEDDGVVQHAVDIGATTIRLGLSPVLRGERDAYGAARWAERIALVRARLGALAPAAADRGITLAIENHQDFGSAELLAFAEEAGENVGLTFDTGNAFPVAESPLAFARAAAHRIRHVHLKDYRVQFTDEGYRLVRCAIGDGAVPFAELIPILLAAGRSLTASLEPGALEARHVRLLTPEWWRGYAPKDARALAETLAAARRHRIGEDEDFRTPWERGASGDELIEYELTMMRRSADNMRALGLLEGVRA